MQNFDRKNIEGTPLEKTIAILGGSGFVGRYVVNKLTRLQWRIRVAGRNPDKAHFLKPLGDVGQIIPMYADITKPRSLPPVLEGAQAVLNLAGVLYERKHNEFAAVHSRGAAVLAELSGRAGIRKLVHVSALGAARGANAHYQDTKGKGEEHMRTCFPRVHIVRPSLIFGAEDAFFQRFASIACVSPVLPLLGGGKTKIQPVYVGDVAAAIVRLLEKPDIHPQTWGLGGPHIYTMRGLFEILREEIRRKCWLLPVPLTVAKITGAVLGILPGRPLLTLDQVRMLETDNVVPENLPGLSELSIAPTSLRSKLPALLARFRPGNDPEL